MNSRVNTVPPLFMRRWGLLITIKSRRTFFPRVAIKGHLIAQVKQFSHVRRVEVFSWFINKIRGDVSQVKIVAVALAQGIDLIKVPYALGPDQRIDGAGSDGNKLALYAMVIRIQERIAHHIDFRLTDHPEILGNFLPVHGCRIDKYLGPCAAVHVQLVILPAVVLDRYHNRRENYRNGCRSPEYIVYQFQPMGIITGSDGPDVPYDRAACVKIKSPNE